MSNLALPSSLLFSLAGGLRVFAHLRRLDRLDETAEHFLLRLLPSLQPIGTIRASRAQPSFDGVPYYKLSRLAVLKDYRKYHFGRELVLALHDWVVIDVQSRGEHPATVVCHSQIPVKAFYAR